MAKTKQLYPVYWTEFYKGSLSHVQVTPSIFAEASYVTGRKSIPEADKFVQKSSKTCPTEELK